MVEGVRISEAAALYGLSPSTLRWWEEQGVLGPLTRVDGRRRYDEQDLRRLGLAYLCCVIGMMPLDRAAVVTSAGVDHQRWHREVGEQASRLDERIAQLQAARGYLRHLMVCGSDDPALCPYLDDHLVERTPRGRIAEQDLAAAARAAVGRYETATGGCYEKIGQRRCPVCMEFVTPGVRGRPRAYCSSACRQRAYRGRRQPHRTTTPV
nr:MerR family transcriptional regulator [Kibdelosporangium sp. MJ126-NF4]CEL19865.1 putative transcriptional regulator, MerR family [Kibdelosporangium sp. MJ126-NF4]CTQ97089.1 putative transcriptional regulator, MerR family [Kibdelosporangium sp. MJ126-NF4]